MADKKKIDEVTGVETTGHEWDGISELNNPMPRWWVSVFYATTIFGLGYTIFFPAWPMINTATAGLLGYTSRGELLNRTIPDHQAKQAVWRDRIAASSLEEIRADESLFNFALAAGSANFALNCSQCHGAGAAGNPGGYPNLNDDEWIWGGDLDNIYATISYGVRQHPEGRYSEMPRFGEQELLSPEEIDAAVQHVLAFTGRETDASLLELGTETWEYNCAACHGEDGKGNPDVGAPNLTDGIWLYGGEADEIEAQIWAPQQGVMPPWIDRLGESAVKELAVYVHSRGGGV
jgi:cytochrome c oxidase cbb3-type subunit 3